MAPEHNPGSSTLGWHSVWPPQVSRAPRQLRCVLLCSLRPGWKPLPQPHISAGPAGRPPEDRPLHAPRPGPLCHALRLLHNPVLQSLVESLPCPLPARIRPGRFHQPQIIQPAFLADACGVVECAVHRGAGAATAGQLSSGINAGQVTFPWLLPLVPNSGFYSRICLLQNLEEASPDQERRDQKTGLMGVVGPLVAFLKQVFLTWQVNRLTTRMCPKKTMSCIGKFRRNAINYKETWALTTFLLIGMISNVIGNMILTHVKLSPSTKFNFNSLFWIFFTEIPFICLTIVLYTREIPTMKKPPKVQFYVLNPSFLPRKSFEVNIRTPRHANPQDALVLKTKCLNLIVVSPQGAETNKVQTKLNGRNREAMDRDLGHHSGMNIGLFHHPDNIMSLSSELATVSN